jgi:hypothetical protein
MMAAVDKHVIRPALELTGVMAPIWAGRAKEEQTAYVDDMRRTTPMLTFVQLNAGDLNHAYRVLSYALYGGFSGMTR